MPYGDHGGRGCEPLRCHAGDQDAFAAESQRRAVEAIEQGRCTEIVPVPIPQKKGEPRVFDQDEFPRAGTTVEKLAG
jgi:acetyl-CoA C-acetyltransferase